MNLLEILTTAEKLEAASVRYNNSKNTAQIISINYMLNAGIEYMKRFQIDYREHDVFTPVSTIIKIAMLFSNDRKPMQEPQDHFETLVTARLEELMLLLKKEFPQEQKFKGEAEVDIPTSEKTDLQTVQTEIEKLQKIKHYADLVFDGVSFPDHESERIYGLLKSEQKSLALLIIQELLSPAHQEQVFRKSIPVQKDEIHDNGTAQKD